MLGAPWTCPLSCPQSPPGTAQEQKNHCQPCKKKEPGTPRNVLYSFPIEKSDVPGFRVVGTRINIFLSQRPRNAGAAVKWQFLLKWRKHAGYSKVSAKTVRAPATRGLQSQAALVSAQRIESCEQSPSCRRALHGACFWGLKNKHFWLRDCGPSLYM